MSGKKDSNYLWSYIVTLAAGILLTVFCNRVYLFHLILIILGIVFLVPAITALIAMMRYRSGKTEHRDGGYVLFTAIASAIFGILLICMPGFFVKYLVYTFAVMLMICGVIQISNLWKVTRTSHYRLIYMIIPILTIASGVAIAIIGPDIQKVVTLITGIALIAYSLNGLIGYAGKGAQQEAADRLTMQQQKDTGEQSPE